jgi:carbon starvation protein CstA
MVTFIVAALLLIGGYFIYGKFIERIFGADPKADMPAYTSADGVDYVPMGWGKIFLIQFLNIAGLGPIFGAVMGATYGPVAFLWIVFGCIFGGAVHDYLAAMLSIRNNGMSLHGIAEKYVGRGFRNVICLFTLVLMVLVGAVFISGPAQLLTNLTPQTINFTYWCILIFIYYVLATLLPIDKLIGRIYPIFGFTLLFMAVGIVFSLFYYHAAIPEVTLENLHNMKFNSGKYPIFPMLFITIACGAISGFHATQSPMMARCLKNERMGRRVFYGAMIVEGLVALIWAAAGMSFFGSVDNLQIFLQENGSNAALVVNKVAHTWLGKVGSILAIIGVIAAPITSGDTAFRSARLIVSDFLHIEQHSLWKRILIAAPLFTIGFILLQIHFEIIWRYFAWMNQTLAAATLWIITIYLVQEHKLYWVSLIPALFMTMVVSCYIVVAPEGLHQSLFTGTLSATGVTLLVSALFLRWMRKEKQTA